MDKNIRAERLICNLRWVIIGLGFLVMENTLPITTRLALLGLVALYNSVTLFSLNNETRYLKWGNRLSSITRILDIVIITLICMGSNNLTSLSYFLYWFVLVQFGYTHASLGKLTISAIIVLLANAGAVYYVGSTQNQEPGILSALTIQSGVLTVGALIAAFIAQTRSKEDIVSDRESYLHSLLLCGTKLTSLRSVQEMALFVLESAISQTKATGGELYLVNEETQKLESEAYFHTPGPIQDEGLTESDRKAYAQWVLGSRREHVTHPGIRNNDTVNLQKNARSVMSVPLLGYTAGYDNDAMVLGVIVVWSRKDGLFSNEALDILQILAAMAGAALINLRLYTNLQRSMLRSLQTLAKSLEARDEYTRGHSVRVTAVAEIIADELGLPDDSKEILKNAALLHDIGKIGIPDAILRKPGKLTSEEWETMRKHPIVSEEICRPLGLPQEVLFLIKHHHEKLDGKGYPNGLSAGDQPLLQRILSVADTFDAMRSRRPYREKMSHEAIISELYKVAGRTIDPTVVDVVRRALERGDMDIIYEEHDRMVDIVSRSENKPLNINAA